ncbi:hypothetical protein [uncultured Dokdonia sp.]|uniref:hypothetical protein n=1 Tax=uncultured Dokdonia sp. TaxID=575653 RepID=UPI00261B1E76|nr:hypothetical protein [uncultured Dokdonia sp.]
MDSLNQIDDDITEIKLLIEKIILDLTFLEICEFKLNKHHIPEIPWGSLKYSGLYLIEIKNQGAFNTFSDWVEDFRLKWADKKYLKSFTSNLKKKRIERHTKLNDWIPLYIGKSKKIEGRIHEHLFKELHKTTFALKLNARDNLFNETFRLSTLKCNVTNYSVIMPILESKFREQINPIIGRQ